MLRLAGLLLLAAPAVLLGQADSRASAKDSAAVGPAQSLPPIIITASRRPVSQAQLGVSASVVTGADLLAEPPLNTADIVSRFPGVYMDFNVGPDGSTNIRLRGADEAGTKVLMDGVEMNASGGAFHFQGITANNLDRVELVRGPQSALHGSSAVAGVVQFFTREGEPGPPQWTIETEGGSGTVHAGHLGADASVRGGSDALRYSVGAGTSSDDGVYDVSNHLTSREASTRLDYIPSGSVTLTGTLRYNYMDSNLPVRNPGATRVPLDPNQHDRNQYVVGGVTATITPSSAWQHQVRLGVFDDAFTYWDQLDTVPPHASIPYFNATAYHLTDLRRSTVSYDATRRFMGSAGRQASLTLGGSLEQEATGDSVSGAFGSGFTPERRNHASMLSELNVTLGAASFLGGTRLEWYPGSGWVAVPRASANVSAIPDRLSLRGAVGRGFIAPNLEQQYTSNAFIVPNPNLKPETSWSEEVGADVTVSPAVTMSATYFQQRFYGIIEVGQAPPPETRGIAENLGRTDANGVEFEVKARLPRGIRASGNLSWLRTVIVDNSGLSPADFPVDSALPERPSLVGGGTIEIPLGRLHALARARVVGRQIVLSSISSGVRENLDPYELYGLTLMYDLSPQWDLFVRGDNLANTYYPAGFDRRGIPRILTVGARLTR